MMLGLIGTCILASVGCGDRSAPTSESHVATSALDARRESARDDFGRPIDFTAHPARVVSLNPTTTEIIFTIGAQSHLVGRSHWDEWPAAAKAVRDVGDGIRPNVEQLIAARPDLVILYASDANRDAATRLAHAGIATLALRINSVADFERATRIIGRVLDDSAAADAVADSVIRSLQRVAAATRALANPTAVWRLADRPPIVVGGGSFMSELMQVAGARNLYGSLPNPSPTVSLEDVVARNPDVVIVGGDIGASASSLSAWRAVPAVHDGHVISMSSDLVARPSVQMGMAAEALARALHPGVLGQSR